MNNNERIIIVDDDPDVGEVLKMMVDYKGFSGLLVDRVEKLSEVLAKDANFQLIILDMLIAGHNGTDICRELKADPLLRHIPVLMFSALPDASELALEAGADDFISKPFEMKLMLDKIHSLLHPDMAGIPAEQVD